ncbi:hypothetical protein RclHR1_09070008 [Rhizophagus clarus]|uniref:GATA-type transcription factor n=1 Tax=Rhizophagus clarus TaxID=94130 RepID=A0A2Z6S3A7_9GLOM|nr:hypothetical protein RclHR1_09070008 [Rhizophagus clarus]GES89706.1 GATA-type transcription factor [Rhizophagus clarus]
MAQSGLSTLNMSSTNFGIPTPPANDTNPFFEKNEKNLNITNNITKPTKIVSSSASSVSSIHDTTSENSTPSTPEPFTQSQSKCRFYITDPSIVPLLVARLAESNNNNVKLSSSLSSFQSGNYGDLPISSSAPSVCDSVSSVPDLSDSASTPISPPDDDSSDSTASSLTDQSCTIPCSASSNSTSSASSSIAITSYSGRVLQKISNTSSKSKSNPDRSIIDEKKSESSFGNPSIVNAIVAASAAPRTVPIPNRSVRRSKRKGIPYKSPSHEDLIREPGFVFRFPIVFDNALPRTNNSNDNDDDKNKEINDNVESVTNKVNKTESSQTVMKNKDNSVNNNSNNQQQPQQHHHHHNHHNHHHNAKPQLAKIIHRPLLLPDIVRKLNQARKNKMRTRPVTRAKNKKENQELDLFKLGYDQMIDSPINNPAAIEEAKARKRRVAVGRPSKKLILPSAGSQVPRSSNSGENKSPRGSSICSTSSSSSSAAAAAVAAAAAYYRMPSSKRRDSMSVSSSLSIPQSELSDFDLNSDNFGDDEDDPDFAPPAKKRRSEVQRGSKTVGRKESSSKVKVCASCRTKSTPCWRPGWSTDLMLCNSCGLRYKKTKCVCVNPECRYIPLKSEYNAMFKKPKNGDSPDPKRCCKCQTPL